jgi:hypothetical protein
VRPPLRYAVIALTADIAAGTAQLEEAASAAAEALATLQSAIAFSQAAMEEEWPQVVQEQADAYEAAMALAGTIATNLDTLDGDIAQLRSSAQAQSAAREAQWRAGWDTRRMEQVLAMNRQTNNANDGSVFWKGTWGQIQQYPIAVGEYAFGYFIVGPWNLIKGVYGLVRHPIPSAQGLLYAATHLPETVAAISADIQERWNAGNVSRGALAFEIATAILPAAKAGQMTKLTTAPRSKRIARTLEDVSSSKVLRVGSDMGGDILPATVVRRIRKGEKIDDLIRELAQATYESGGLEHAVVSLKDGTRVVVRGGSGGIQFGDDIKRVIGHTHPSPTGPSPSDFDMLLQLGQRHSYIYELFASGLSRFGL